MIDEIIVLKPDHSVAIAQIHQEAFLKGFWTVKAFQELLANPQNFAFGIKDSTGELKGFIVGQIVCDEMEILTLAVKPSNQQQGLGRLLVMHLIEKGKAIGVHQTFLEVHENNQKAIALYQSLGFEKYGSRPDYYLSSKGIQGSALLMKIEHI